MVIALGCSGATTSDGDAAADVDASPPTDASSPPPIDTSACPGGVAPELADCSTALFHADCGGDADSVLACSNSHCKWFEGGCPADRFRPIDCPLGDPFCVETADGDWPYENGIYESPFPSHMCDQLDLIGDAVVTAGTGPWLDLTIDADVSVPESPEMDCDEVGLHLCTSVARGRTIVAMPDSLTFAFSQPSEVGETLTFELIEDPSGGWTARAYLSQFTDFWSAGEDCSQYISGFGTSTEPRPVLTGGELTLAAIPDTTTPPHGQASVRTADGGTMTLRF